MEQYYYKRLKKIKGPYSKEELKYLLLLPGTWIRIDEQEHWKTLSETSELFELLPVAKKRQNILYSIIALIIAILLFFILFFVYKSLTSEEIIQEVKAKQEMTVPFKNEAIKVVVKDEVEQIPAIIIDDDKLKTIAVKPIFRKKEKPFLPINKTFEKYKQDIRSNFQNYISVSSSSYRSSDIDGVTDIDIVVNNTSVFQVDMVEVFVIYKDIRGIQVDMQIIPVRCIYPLDERHTSAPANNKASHAQFIIHTVTSRALNLCYSSEMSIKGNDPFYCK